MSRPGFLDVSKVHPRHQMPEDKTYITDGILVRDFAGRIVESLLITPDGHFQSSLGKVHRDDVGQFVIRVAGHPYRGQLGDKDVIAA